MSNTGIADLPVTSLRERDGSLSQNLKPRRNHTWTEAHRDFRKTDRQCIHCGLVRTTRHEHDQHWIEFYRGLERVEGKGTPVCEVISE